MRPRDTTSPAEIRSRRGETGSSLVELTIAIAAAVTIVAAVLTATVRHSSHRQANQERGLATLAALDTLERLRSIPFDTLPSFDGTGFDVADPNGNPGGLHPVDGDSDGLPGRLVVRPYRTAGSETIYQVAAIVEWSGQRPQNDLGFRHLMVERK